MTPLDPQTKRKIIEFRAAGHSQEAVATMFSVKQSTVSKILAREQKRNGGNSRDNRRKEAKSPREIPVSQMGRRGVSMDEM